MENYLRFDITLPTLDTRGTFASCPINLSRHMPISRELIWKYSRHPISTWVKIFRKDLEPWGGSLFFVVGQSWKDGPVAPIPQPMCELCSPSYGDDYIVEDSDEDSLFEGYYFHRKDSLRNPLLKCQCSSVDNREHEFLDSDLYERYIDSFICDMKYVYLVNGWPYIGEFVWHPYPQQCGKTIEEVMVLERQKLRPWGGPWGFKWHTLEQTPQLVRLTTLPQIRIEEGAYNSPYWNLFNLRNWTDEDNGWVDDTCPWYNLFLEKQREHLWNTIHKYDDPDV